MKCLGGKAATVIIGRIPDCWGQCWVHRAGGNIKLKCGDKPKPKKAKQ